MSLEVMTSEIEKVLPKHEKIVYASIYLNLNCCENMKSLCNKHLLGQIKTISQLCVFFSCKM